MVEEEEDKVDSDFDLDSSEGEQDHIEEGKALDKQLEKSEKRVRYKLCFMQNIGTNTFCSSRVELHSIRLLLLPPPRLKSPLKGKRRRIYRK